MIDYSSLPVTGYPDKLFELGATISNAVLFTDPEPEAHTVAHSEVG